MTIKKISKLQIESIIKQYSKTAVDTASIWHNANPVVKSLRLNKSGLMIIKDIFKIYPIPLKPGFQVKTIHIKYLEQDIQYPYYIDSNKLILCNDRDALEIKLHDGDLDAWSRVRWIGHNYQEPPKLPENEL